MTADVASTIRALADAVVPEDDTIGAAAVGAEHFVVHYLELARPGSPDVLAASLDGIAAASLERELTAGLFASLSVEGRLAALRALCEHEVADLRDLGDLACSLVLAAFYGEWTGFDADGRLTATPVGWELTGYPGPASSAPGLLRG